nr:sulfite exporter TauE/SafE family protein [uncultured Pseudodesulfovibrio sp.]
MQDILLICTIVVAASFLQGLTGFGFALIALPLLGFLLDIKTSVPLMTLLAWCISLTLSLQMRHDIRLKKVSILMIATIPGIMLGIYVLKHVPSEILSLGIGILMVAFTVYQLTVKPTPRNSGRIITSIAGFTSGVLGGSIGAGGPPVIVYSAIQSWSKNQAKATLAAYFTISGVLVAGMHAYSGLTTLRVLKLFMYALPALALGVWLGAQAYTRLSDHGYKRLAFILVFMLGCMMIYRTI